MVSNDKQDIKKLISEEILSGTSPKIKQIINNVPERYLRELEEIRIRLHKPLMIVSSNDDYMITERGEITKKAEEAYTVTGEDCDKTIQLLSNYSVYALEEELKNGYITLRGGHRVGLAGRGIIESGRIKALKNISSFNIRVARQVIGAADNIINYIIRNENDIYNSIIISPPECGKTTILRDIIRQLSCGIPKYRLKGLKIGVVDERSEIAGSYMGVPQNDVGYRTDVLDACPKSSGLIMLIRSMSPNVIATDEIGSKADVDAIYEAINAGVRLITTIHGNGIDDLLRRPFINEPVKEGIFERIFVLSSRFGPGTVEEVIDGTNFSKIINKPFR